MGGRGSSAGASGSPKYAYGSQMGARTRDAIDAYWAYGDSIGVNVATAITGDAFDVKQQIDQTLANKGPNATYGEMSDIVRSAFDAGKITATQAGILQVYYGNIVYGAL